jgi:hypothetical protein
MNNFDLYKNVWYNWDYINTYFTTLMELPSNQFSYNQLEGLEEIAVHEVNDYSTGLHKELALRSLELGIDPIMKTKMNIALNIYKQKGWKKDDSKIKIFANSSSIETLQEKLNNLLRNKPIAEAIFEQYGWKYDIKQITIWAEQNTTENLQKKLNTLIENKPIAEEIFKQKGWKLDNKNIVTWAEENSTEQLLSKLNLAILKNKN